MVYWACPGGWWFFCWGFALVTVASGGRGFLFALVTSGAGGGYSAYWPDSAS